MTSYTLLTGVDGLRLTYGCIWAYNSNRRLIHIVRQASDTKDLILATAEALFGEKGVAGVSLRTLTGEAGVNLAAVHYHFGSKQEVVKAVFSRCAAPVNRERLAMLDAVETRGDSRVEDILLALITPPFRLARDPVHGKGFTRLLARFYSEPLDYLEDVFEAEFAEVINRFERAFARALPALSRDDLRRRMHFAIGVMVHVLLDSDRTKKWTAGVCDLSDAEATLGAIVSFAAAGMRAGQPTVSRARRGRPTAQVLQ